jgi:hypothetical protein
VDADVSEERSAYMFRVEVKAQQRLLKSLRQEKGHRMEFDKNRRQMKRDSLFRNLTSVPVCVLNT